MEGAAVPNARMIVNHTPEMQEQMEQEAEAQAKQEREERHAEIDQDLLQENMWVSRRVDV